MRHQFKDSSSSWIRESTYLNQYLFWNVSEQEKKKFVTSRLRLTETEKTSLKHNFRL